MNPLEKKKKKKYHILLKCKNATNNLCIFSQWWCIWHVKKIWFEECLWKTSTSSIIWWEIYTDQSMCLWLMDLILITVYVYNICMYSMISLTSQSYFCLTYNEILSLSLESLFKTFNLILNSKITVFPLFSDKTTQSATKSRQTHLTFQSVILHIEQCWSCYSTVD